MTVGPLSRRLRQLAAVIALVLVPALLLAAGPRAKAPKPGQFNPRHETVKMFEAIEKGEIGVTLIPKNSTQCRVLIENKTDRPLNVELPAAAAGVHVLAQVPGGGGMGAGGMGGGQGMGMGMGAGMGGMGGGFFNVPPEKVGKLKLPAVCLEHGKPDPKPAMKYEIRPIESFTSKTEVHELCRMLGTGRLSQRAAQAAAWNLNCDMSWQQLAAKRLRFANGSSRPYFSPQEIHAGMQIAATATALAEKRKNSPAESESASTR